MWTSDWPRKSGFYWFYGKCFRDRVGALDRKSEMFFVKVRKISNGFAYVTDGHFIGKEEGAVGQWTPAEVPNPPTGEKDG